MRPPGPILGRETVRASRRTARASRVPSRALALGSLVFMAAAVAPPGSASDAGLQAFRAWLDREHPGYGCDEGPAPFRNRTVEAAYPGRRFYYVLTYTRGIPPPFQKALSLVAATDDGGRVIPFRAVSPQTYQRGLVRVSSKKDAKLAAAAVLTLASCDPGGRRWAYRPESFKAKKDSKGWRCSYRYDAHFESWVRFDRTGALQEFGGSAPPVP